jgi:hypothetical protein
MILFVALYLIVGIFILAWCANYMKGFPDMWSPIQPIGFIIIWPVILILNVIRYIKNNI